MQNLSFIEVAEHNAHNLKRNTKAMLIIIAICLIGVIVSRIFYDDYTYDAVYLKSGMATKAGWPAQLFSISSWGLIAFSLFFVLLKLAQDVNKPAFAITNEGIFINQQMIRNAFVPWSNIENIELSDIKDNPVIRLKFKDIDALLKGQFFMYKSISKASLNTNPKFAISKDNCVGDLKKMYEMIQAKMQN